MPQYQQIFNEFLGVIAGCGKRSTATVRSYEREKLGKFVAHMSHKPISTWSLKDFQDFIAKRNWGARSQSKFFWQCKKFIRWCGSNNYAVPDFTAGHELPTPERKQPRGIEWSEVERLLEFTKGTRLEVAVCCAGLLGLRRGEIVALRWADVDFESNRMRVYSPKTKRERWVMLGNTAKEILLRHKGARGLQDKVLDWPTFAGVHKHGHRALRKACAKLQIGVLSEEGKLRPIGFHALRHTVATYAHACGASLADVRDFLGHTNVATTDIYLGFNADAAARVARIVEDGGRPGNEHERTVQPCRLRLL